MLREGTRLQGRYTVLRLVGQGGMGAVYLCSDDRLPEATWALKELHREPQEAQVLSKLEHPRLPHLVDFFSENGRFYLVREYFPGINLAEKVERDGVLGEAQTLAWALQMADVLDFLHSQKPPVLYRDLKPQNIVLSPGGLKLIDFGLAGVAKPGPESDPLKPVGSLSYSAPEQLDDPAAACEASNLYGLGAVLYFLLLGHPPSPIAGRHRLLPHRPDLNPETEELILRCMEPDPRRRFTSASEFTVAVQFLCSRYPRLMVLPAEEAVQTFSEAPPLRPPPRRRPRWLSKVLSMLVFGLVFLASGWFILQSLPTGKGHILPKPWVASLPTAWAKIPPGTSYPQPTSEQWKTWFHDQPGSAVARLLQSNLELPKGAMHIPLLAPMTGDYAEFGEWMVRGVVLLVDELGPEAPYVELYDTGVASQEALRVAQVLVKRKELKGMLGPFTSQLALLVAPVCNMEHFSLISPAATDPRMGAGGPYIFSLAPPQKERFQALVDALVRRGARKVLILQPDSASFYYSVADVFEERLQALKQQEPAGVRRLVFPSDLKVKEDFPSQVFSQPFDCVFVADNRAGQTAQMVQFLRKNGFNGPVACLVHPGSRELLLGGRMEGVLLVSFMGLDNLPRLDRFLKRHRELFQEDASITSAITYCAAHQLWQACGLKDREAAQRQLAKGCVPDVAFGQATSMGQVYVVEGGRYVVDRR